jgi:hypothetical protein
MGSRRLRPLLTILGALNRIVPTLSGRWCEVGVYGDEREARIKPFAAAPLNVARWWD